MAATPPSKPPGRPALTRDPHVPSVAPQDVCSMASPRRCHLHRLADSISVRVHVLLDFRADGYDFHPEGVPRKSCGDGYKDQNLQGLRSWFPQRGDRRRSGWVSPKAIKPCGPRKVGEVWFDARSRLDGIPPIVHVERSVYLQVLYVFLTTVKDQQNNLQFLGGWFIRAIDTDDKIRLLLSHAEEGVKNVGHGLWQLVNQPGGYTEDQLLAQCRRITPRSTGERKYGLVQNPVQVFPRSAKSRSRLRRVPRSSRPTAVRIIDCFMAILRVEMKTLLIGHYRSVKLTQGKQDFFLQWEYQKATSNETLVMEQYAILRNKSYYGSVLRYNIPINEPTALKALAISAPTPLCQARLKV